MARILFYTSIQTRVRDQESLMVEFVRQGHQVFFLNQQPNPYLPAICKEAGVTYQTLPTPRIDNSYWKLFFYWKQLVWFAWRNKVDVIYSHLEPANFIAVFVQFFIRAKVVVVRHHLDLAQLAGFSNDLSYKITYRLARTIIVVSERAKQFMIEQEGVAPGKIYPVRLGYDFSCFGEVNNQKVATLKQRLSGKVCLITVGRLDLYKRPEISLEILRKLLADGVSAHLIFLGSGDQRQLLEARVNEFGLGDLVEFLGYADDVLTYLKASDWLIHPSISESSCVVIKEAGLVELPVIVCKGVGDFDEYLVHGKNSFLVDPEKFVGEASAVIKQQSGNKAIIGKLLNKEIMSRFHISSVIGQYKIFNGE